MGVNVARYCFYYYNFWLLLLMFILIYRGLLNYTLINMYTVISRY